MRLAVVWMVAFLRRF